MDEFDGGTTSEPKRDHNFTHDDGKIGLHQAIMDERDFTQDNSYITTVFMECGHDDYAKHENASAKCGAADEHDESPANHDGECKHNCETQNTG